MPHSNVIDRPCELNLAYLESSAFGQSEFVLRAIDILLEQLPEQVADLNHAYSEHDWPHVRLAAHKLKSAAGLLGMEPLKRTLRNIEGADPLDSRAMEDLEVWISEVNHTCAFVQQELQAERYRFA